MPADDDSHHGPHSVAYLHEIPGARCGPEDNSPKAYTILQDSSHIWEEMSVLARPESMQFGDQGLKADSLNFQPCPTARSQDRCVVQQLDIHGKSWMLTGVFDVCILARQSRLCGLNLYYYYLLT
jgi:pyruvate dehydrogenase phosphatase